MSSVPPNMPPGGAPPPYDPHTQWRIYREQQKAAWRQQREAWRGAVCPAECARARRWRAQGVVAATLSWRTLYWCDSPIVLV